ncbi:MAG TPA: PepSY-associated TM helix domain-containing protein [Polyangiaceae bacterium]|nr:PepSY-associated TM helix domain-containing protein [Polyangiaceae bacterium]
MSPALTRRLLAFHRWAGLLLSLNVLVFAVTGLILIFHEEIGEALAPVMEQRAASEPMPLRDAIAMAQKKLPGTHAVFVSRELEHPHQVFVGLGKDSRKLADTQAIKVDLTTGNVDDRDFDDTFIGVVFHLHAQLMAGPIGGLLVGALGLALLLTLITGAVIYGPMMKRFAFGVLRRDKHRRTLFADLHKLVGVSIFGWLSLVVATGILLSLGSILLQLYSQNELRALAKVDATQQLIEGLPVVDVAVASAEKSSGGRQWTIAILPGSDLSSPRHFSILMSGGSGIAKRLLRIALVDAANPSSASFHDFPLYLQALLISEPLHFGDYGGLPLKLLWALFTLALIVLSATGVYTFFSGRRGLPDKLSLRAQSAAVPVEGAT